MIKTIPLNNDWTFYPVDHPEQKTTVRLPHTNRELPFNYFDERMYQFISCYEKNFYAPEEWEGSRLFIVFEGVAQSCEVYLNGVKVGSHSNGYNKFRLDLTDAVRYKKFNTLVVTVNAKEDQDIPPFGHVIDYLTYGGIYREVYFELKGAAALEHINVVADELSGTSKQFHVDYEVLSFTESSNMLETKVRILKGGKVLLEKNKIYANYGKNKIDLSSDAVELWDQEHPNLYEAELTIAVDGVDADCVTTTFGLRTCEFKKDGFYLNGKKVMLRGLDRHQSFAYVGYAMPKSMQIEDARILQEELGCNAVRTSHYPQSKYFLDECDKRGLLVFTEAPGWQHIDSSKKWRAQHIRNIREMIWDDWNHPSIVLWGVRINESLDDDELYKEANKAAHELDQTRQTSGVRYLKYSHLLEDVYAFNDFSHRGNNAGITKKEFVTLPKNPYLISEHDGHMFPTKTSDDEEHRLSQALRHARVVDDAEDPDNGVSGVFGWCYADYNTHKDFGSGDRICYHGVMDMFRNPKLAAALYESQGEDHDVLRISSTMDIGEHPGTWIGDIYAFTNADSVKLYKNGDYVQTFTPDRETYPNLKHPPILVDDIVGVLPIQKDGLSVATTNLIRRVVKDYIHTGSQSVIKPANAAAYAKALKEDRLTPKKAKELFFKYSNTWGADVTTYTFEAIKGGRVVKTVVCGPSMEFKLEPTVSSFDLKEEETYDVAAIRIAARSEDGLLLHYANDPISLSVDGPIALIGPSIVPLRGGYAGTYVKTTGETGTGTLTIHCDRCEDITIEFNVTKAD